MQRMMVTVSGGVELTTYSQSPHVASPAASPAYSPDATAAPPHTARRRTTQTRSIPPLRTTDLLK